MNIPGNKSILCLVFQDRAVAVAEMRPGVRGPRAARSARWPFPPEKGAEALGRAFRRFLRDNGFGRRPAVFGIPARWMTTRLKKTPVAEKSVLAELVGLEAENDFSLPPGELVLDYRESECPGGESEKPFLELRLAALGREKFDFLIAFARGAGLKLLAVTPANWPLAERLAKKTPGCASLHIGPEDAEFYGLDPSGPFLARPLGRFPAAGPGHAEARALAREISMVISLLPGDKTPREIILHDDAGLPGDFPGTVAEHLALPSRPFGAANGNADAGRDGIPARALAELAGAVFHSALPLDFLHSKLQVRPERSRLPRVAAAAALLAIVAALAWNQRAMSLVEAEIAFHEARLAEMRPEIEAAGAALGYAGFLEGWMKPGRPFLECLGGIAAAWPETGAVWVTSLSIGENMRGTATGQAENSRLVLETIDRIAGSASFPEVRLLYLRDSGSRDGSVAYAFDFSFRPENPPGPEKGAGE